jgi:hypothetical protein
MGDEVYRWTQNDHHFEPDSAESANNGSWNGWKKQEDANGDDRVVWEMVQFHSGYTYEDFIRGISIDTDSDGGSGGFSDASFVSEDGILTQLATVAAHDKGPEKVVLVIDELNRGDVGSIFGEAILAIEADKRGDWPIRLKHDAPEGYDGGRTLTLPENLYIIGTMNTADESVALIDHAVRRRFRFIDVLPSEGVLHDYYKGEVPARVQRQITGLFVELSRKLDLDPEYAIGHSYFMHNDAEEWVSDGEKVGRWNTELLPLLRDYYQKGVLSENPAGYFGIKNSSQKDFTIQSKWEEIKEERNPYVVNINDYEEGSRNPEKWFEHGFIAGGWKQVDIKTDDGCIRIEGNRYEIKTKYIDDDSGSIPSEEQIIKNRRINTNIFDGYVDTTGNDTHIKERHIDEKNIHYPDKSESSLHDIINVAEDGDVVLPRWDKDSSNKKGVVALSVVTSGRTIECFEQSKQRIDQIFDNQSTNSYVENVDRYKRSDDVGLGEHYPDGVVRVNHLFSLPCIRELSGCDNPDREIGTQVIGSNKRIGNKDQIPGNFKDEMIVDITDKNTDTKHFRPVGTASGLKNKYKKCFLYQIVSYFQKEYRFSPHDLPDKYLNDEGGRVREVERQLQGMSAVYGERNPELSVVDGSEDAPFRARVWIPVFSDPFAIRDDELLFDGENIHVISRVRDNEIPDPVDFNSNDKFDPEEHLYRYNRCSNELCEPECSTNKENNHEWNYRGSLSVCEFIKRRIIEELNYSDGKNDQQLRILYRAALFCDRNAEYLNQQDSYDGYQEVGERIAEKFNSIDQSRWKYNELPRCEQICPSGLDAPLPDDSAGTASSTVNIIGDVADCINPKVEDKDILGFEKDGDDGWYIIDDKEQLENELGSLQFNLEAVLESRGNNQDPPDWYGKIISGED